MKDEKCKVRDVYCQERELITMSMFMSMSNMRREEKKEKGERVCVCVSGTRLLSFYVFMYAYICVYLSAYRCIKLST